MAITPWVMKKWGILFIAIFLMLFIIGYLINSDSDVSTKSVETKSSNEDAITLSEKIYSLNYQYGYKSGYTGGKGDKEINHEYSPETLLANPLMQAMVKKYSDSAVEKFGEGYRLNAEKGFKDGFMAGYKDGYK